MDKFGELLNANKTDDSFLDGLIEPLLPLVLSPNLTNNAEPMDAIEFIEIDDSFLDGLIEHLLPLVLSHNLANNAEPMEAVELTEIDDSSLDGSTMIVMDNSNHHIFFALDFWATLPSINPIF